MNARILPIEFVNAAPPRMLFLGSYPPRECGIATFTKDVVDSFCAQYKTSASVIAIDEIPSGTRQYPSEVIGQLQQHDRSTYAHIARVINDHPSEILNIQHEYGLFGGEEGEWVLDILRGVHKPIVISLHTVLPEPEAHHLWLAQQICENVSSIVVLSETGKALLTDVYGVPAEKISVIHHGVPDVPFQTTERAKAAFGVTHRNVISTFGLISRGKGLEYAIEAMRLIVDKHPEALYLILGQTHPAVRRHEGESYRESLAALIAQYKLENHVTLVDRYLEFSELVRYLSATDIYLTPYLNPTQIVSGTLAYAVGSGKAVVSTPYLYAQELLAHGRGFLTGFRDAQGTANTISALLGDPALRRATERRAYRYGRRMTWSHVASEYGEVFSALRPRTNFRELSVPA